MHFSSRSSSAEIPALKSPVPERNDKLVPKPVSAPPKPVKSRGKEIKASDLESPAPCARKLRERSGENRTKGEEKRESKAETWRIDYIRVETEEKKPKKKKSKIEKKKEKIKPVAPLVVKEEYPRKLTVALAPIQPKLAEEKNEVSFNKFVFLETFFLIKL